MIYEFGIAYGNPPHFNTHVEFEVDLSDDQVSFLKEWLKENGECDYAYLESDNSELFELINDATSNAILEEYNSWQDTPIDFSEMDWPSIYVFYWDKKLVD